MSRWILQTLLFAGLLATASRQSTAQSLRDPKDATIQRASVPKAHLPPPGMCRIWIDNVPAGQQPAPTDCANAIRNRPPNGRVVFSDDSTTRAKPKAKDGRDNDKPAKRRKP
jgi:hypothetical protein